MKKEPTFMKYVKVIMGHNNYKEDWLTVDICEENNRWTPVDLIIREHLNNGSGSARGFLGITPSRNEELYSYVVEHSNELIKKNLISRNGFNNCGFPLWHDYDF